VDWFVDALQHYPEISIFLALALGYWLGSLKLGSFSLGSVTGTLLMAVLIGQLHIAISANVKATCFLLFLFLVGYGVGPEFFRGLRRDGLPQMIFAAMQCVVSLATGYGVAKAFGYDVGQAAGLLAGSQTISALLGTATDAINKLAIPDEEKKRLLEAMTVAYAVTYIFGTAGTAWILSALGPRLVGGNVTAACREYEAGMSVGAADGPEIVAAHRLVALRARQLTGHRAADTTRDELESVFLQRPVFAAHSLSTPVLVALRREVKRPTKPPASPPRAVSVNAVIFVAAGITSGGLVGALAIRIGEVPLSLSTSGGALVAGLVFGWLRSSYRIFEGVAEPALATLNSVGLNMFIAVVGINAGPGFVAGLGEAGPGLFVAGIFVTAIPLIVGLLLARYVFRFHPGVALGCVAGARTTAAALGAVQDVVRSKVPALGYTVPYAVGNTLLTLCGIAIVMLMT
jgi:AspT/YidE/YbjL antiporter-like protein